MTIGSLFSGIGGLELGLEWAGLGPVLWQVEIDPKCRNCLATHWPEAERFEDVCKVGRNELAPVDLICGGFPCQDVSSAGKRVGLSGARSGLWFEFLRILSELLPSWVAIENVASGASKWVDEIRRGLEQLGYASLPIPLSAGDCGAWHKRARVFIVAYRACSKQDAELTEQKGREKPDGNASHPHSQLLRQQPGRGGGPNRLEPSKPELHCGWETESDVARVVHGISGRVDRERALGNSVVPQCAEVVGWVIRELEETR